MRPIHLKVVNFSKDASGGTFTVDEFAPLMERRAGCSYIFSQTSPIRHPIDMSENLHGPVVDEMGLQYHKQSNQANSCSSSPSMQWLHGQTTFLPFCLITWYMEQTLIPSILKGRWCRNCVSHLRV